MEEQALAAIARAYRRPKMLRQLPAIQSRSLLLGARETSKRCQLPLEQVVSAYSLLMGKQTPVTMKRAPLQVVARIDVLLGGVGRPVQHAPELFTLARTITAGEHDIHTPASTYVQLLQWQPFGQRSEAVARIAARAAAAASAIDPAAVCLIEPYLTGEGTEQEYFHALYQGAMWCADEK